MAIHRVRLMNNFEALLMHEDQLTEKCNQTQRFNFFNLSHL